MENYLKKQIIQVLDRKYPNRRMLINELTNILAIERDSVYRKLREESSFSAEQFIKIASTWDIALEDFTENNSQNIYFKLMLLDYLEPSDEQVEHVKELIERLNDFGNYSNMEYMEVSNKLPRILISGFPNLDKFQLLKWTYKYSGKDEIPPFSKTSYSKKLFSLTSNYYKATKNIRETIFVWDNLIFERIKYDIEYFCSIGLVTDKEKQLVKKDLLALLEYMYKVSNTGCWPETSNKVYLYISNTNIDTHYSHYYSDEFKMCSVYAFGRNEIQTNNPIITDKLRNWMQTNRKLSILISETNEKNRIEFFNKQRQIISTL
jgi:hypothetical protein